MNLFNFTLRYQIRFADAGGLIGLFMGCSLLSFAEIIYFFIQCCLAKTRKIKILSLEDNITAGLDNKNFIQTLYVINENRTFVTSQPLYHKNLNN